MIYTPMTRKALLVACQAHKGQQDCSGLPYIFHPYHVAEQMNDEFTTCIALLHDVMEDTDVTEEELAKQFPEEVIEVLRLLTHDHAISYTDYIRKLSKNPAAKAVKLADIAHNMDESRVSGTDVPKERLQHWHRKYTEALKILAQQDD